MTSGDDYVDQLRRARDPIAFLRKHSNLPGPRANLELAQAAADVADEPALRRWIAVGSGNAPTDEFLVLCGVIGLGKLVAEGKKALIDDLRRHACDSRWRVREGVVLGLQRLGDRSADGLLSIAESWTMARPYLERAAVAAVCEPRLLKAPSAARRAVDLVDEVTASAAKAAQPRSDEFRALRQTLGYCWSVAIGAAPAYGKRKFERWVRSTNPDIRWIVKENLRKNRLIKTDAVWTSRLAKRLP
jgi:hypothetical protein